VNRKPSNTPGQHKTMSNRKRINSAINSTDNTDDQSAKISKTTGTSIGSYTLMFGDGKSVIFDAPTSNCSSFLSNCDSDTPIHVPKFPSASARTLKAFINGTIDTTSDLDPALYATTLHLCDFLQMDKDICVNILQHLESPIRENPLARFHCCIATLPNVFASMLYSCFDFCKSVEGVQQLIHKIVACGLSELTYKELNLMDGKYNPSKSKFSSLPLFVRYASTERQVRANKVLAARNKTKALRANLEFKSAPSDAAVESAFRAALWGSSELPQTSSPSAGSSAALSKELLDIEMWRAIKAGRVDVAQRVLDLGGHPVLYQLPKGPYNYV
jgi:hypothetical protein